MIKKIRKIAPDIPEPFRPLNDKNVRKIVEVSGRSSGKSTTNETFAVLLMLASKFNNIWYCRAESGDLRRTVFASALATIQALFIEDLFEVRFLPLEIRCKRTGARMYFSGINGKTIDDLNATKGFVPQYRSLAMFIVDEANEVKCWEHIKAAEATANKFLQENGKIVYAYNPPPIRAHWANIKFEQMVSSGEAVKIYSTWEDIRKLLKPATIAEIEWMRNNDPRHYSYMYLGEIVSLEGLVLYTFKRERNVITLEELQNKMRGNYQYQPVQMIYGVDSGIVHDATAVSAWGIYPDGNMIKLSTFYHVPGDTPTPNSKQAQLIIDWYVRFRKKMAEFSIIVPNAYNEAWVFDNAVVTQDLMFEFQNKTGFNVKAVENKSIDRDIKRLQNGYFNGFLKILDIEDNKASFDEINTFSYDERNRIPEGQADHTIDADKYATAHYYYMRMAA